MHYVCPVCKSDNNYEFKFPAVEYICRSCSNLIDILQNTSLKVVKKPIENVVLEIGKKGLINNIQYHVAGIITRKYGTNIYWREYYLKDEKGNDAFLSESEGHWVFLLPQSSVNIKQKSSKLIQLGDTTYRWYETTPCTIHAAAGFFEDKLNFNIATYKEYVNGTSMISQEQSDSSVEYFTGKHIAKSTVKKAFNITDLPNYYGIGIVQPFYINVRQAINILAVTALLICLIQLNLVMSRTNANIFEQEIEFASVTDKELMSKTFELSGGSAPLEVEAYSDVDNSWANVSISLVNEKTNEMRYTSKDIERYSGFEGGESWSEGSRNEEFNICGVAPGKYHFLISAEKEGGIPDPFKTGYLLNNGDLSVIGNDKGEFYIKNNKTKNIQSYSQRDMLKNEIIGINNWLNQPKEIQKLDSIITFAIPIEYGYPQKSEANPSVRIKAIWQPVSFWNFGIVLTLLIAFGIICHVGKGYFEKAKWNNSSNSPYQF